MEEEVGVKATRLRRRLSVDADDVKSPATQSTPTKKRGGKLAAKPQLELIDENATETEKPKRTRKPTVRDAEPDSQVLTPSRRSTRIRSNTSIVSEIAGETDDKLTPSRRNTRIKSNTSIVAEIVQRVDSPRAKRAARRLSQVGSDNEAPVTPARSTRRGRKDSASSIDKQVELNSGKLETKAKDIIIEIIEINDSDSISSTQNKKDSPSTRKSPRLIEKTDKAWSDSNNKENEIIKKSNTNKKDDDADVSIQSLNNHNNKISSKINLSVSTSELINQLDEKPRKKSSNLNKTTSAMEGLQSPSKRHRTKSCTTITSTPPNDNKFLSDTESIRKKNRKTSTIFDSGIKLLNCKVVLQNSLDTSAKTTLEQHQQHEIKDISLTYSSVSENKKKQHDKSIIEPEIPIKEAENVHIDSNTPTTDENNFSSQIKKVGITAPKEDINFTEKFFSEAPSGTIQSLVYIEDSDSNTGDTDKKNAIEIDRGDQLVPVVEHQFDNQISNEAKTNLEHEPMDIDETMPANISLSVFTGDKTSETVDTKEVALNKSSLDNSKRKSWSVSVEGNTDSKPEDGVKNSLNISKGKSISTADDGQHDDSSHFNEYSLNMSTNKFEGKYNPNDDISKVNKSNSPPDIVKDVNDIRFDKSLTIGDSIYKSPNNSVSNLINENMESGHLDKSNVNNESKNLINVSLKKSRKVSLATDTATDSEGTDADKSKRKSSSSNVNSYTMDRNTSNSDDKEIKKTNRKSSSLITDKCNESIETSTKIDTSKSIIKSVFHVESQLCDKSDSENKSTLILTEIKNTSDASLLKNVNLSKDCTELLSLSMNMPKVYNDIECNKKNMSLTYSTSTPLHQKPLKKLGMQMNSSIITPTNVTKSKNKISLDTSKKKSVEISQNSEESESSDEENSDEEPADCSKMIDDEAEDASDDYESGDSRDESSREYEEAHEIIERGETLDSEEEDISDDSEYEKGSFIVDSDEEDAELLSGSGDDLSISANELSMSAKSKMEFNKRKLKEQKRASREMFEARHNLKKSDKLESKTMAKRQRLQSSESEPEVGVIDSSKNKRRPRIDSSQDSMPSDSDKSINKRKVKRLPSESISEENASKENEISIQEISEKQNDDPLSLQNIVKVEIKTPQKDRSINLSRVPILDDFEKVNIETNVSIMKSQTCDPLQVTLAQDEVMNDDTEESISENEELTQNYESMLNELKKKSKRIKSIDLSLNLDKKVKQKVKEAVVDQLNLTQVKKSKKSRPEKEVKNKLITNKIKNVNNQDEGSSDIDMKLLFNDDSTDGEFKNKQTAEEFIPLKRTEGKTNILDSTNETENLNFFIDTTGTHTDVDDNVNNISVKRSAKKKKQNNNVSISEMGETPKDDISNEAPLEISYQGNKNKDTSKLDLDVMCDVINPDNKTPNSGKKNKKKKKSLDISQNIELAGENSIDIPLEISFQVNKNKDTSKLDLDDANINEVISDNKTPKSGKKNKKKKKSLDTSQNIELADENFQDAPLEVSYKGNKNKDTSKLDVNISQIDNSNITDSKTPTSVKKNKKGKGLDSSQSVDNTLVEHVEVTVKEVSKKRKRKSSATITTEETTINDTAGALNEENKPAVSKENQQIKKRKVATKDEIQNDTNTEAKVLEGERQSEKGKVKNNTVLEKSPVANDDFTKKSKKRKERDDDSGGNISKVLKQNSSDKIHVPRLPTSVIKELDSKTRDNDTIQPIVSTTAFQVEKTRQKRSKPSNYLEQSVYLNDSVEVQAKKPKHKNPKVLPFLPTVSTSDHGFTTKFTVNVIPQETQFVAQSTDVSNFKNDYLQKNRIKKLGTFEKYKRHRNIKISKF